MGIKWSPIAQQWRYLSLTPFSLLLSILIWLFVFPGSFLLLFLCCCSFMPFGLHYHQTDALGQDYAFKTTLLCAEPIDCRASASSCRIQMLAGSSSHQHLKWFILGDSALQSQSECHYVCRTSLSLAQNILCGTASEEVLGLYSNTATTKTTHLVENT